MKKLSALTNIISAIVILYVMASCQATSTANSSAIATSQKEMLLSQAGFHTLTVTTPTQKQHVEALPVGKVSAVTYKGKLYYVYPTGQKDRIYYGRQAQFNAYKQSLRAQQGEQQMAGSPTFTEEGAGPYHIQVQQFDGFGPMYDDSWDQ